jgi:DNA-directed RNA polymerase specialized sigma24 family protein
VRWPNRPDPHAARELERRVRAWASVRAFGLHRDAVDEVAADTCAEVWRHLNLSRGGAAFEGFVQGRFAEVLRTLHGREGAMHLASSGPDKVGAQFIAPVGIASERATATPLSLREERLGECLDDLRSRNPRHYRALELIHADEASPSEAADVLAIDVWTVRALLTRAGRALAQDLDWIEQWQTPGTRRRGGSRSGPKPKRPGGGRSGRARRR